MGVERQDPLLYLGDIRHSRVLPTLGDTGAKRRDELREDVRHQRRVVWSRGESEAQLHLSAQRYTAQFVGGLANLITVEL